MFMLEEIIILIFMTMIPFLELRASIPYGILFLGMNWFLVFFVCVISNILLAPLVYIFVNYIMKFFLKIQLIDKIYKKLIIRTQKRVEPYVDKYGKIGLALFIGIPFPGSGVYSGGLGAYLLGFDFKDYIKASIIGVLIAGVLVTLICLFGNGAWNFFIKV
ncbi:hypothetical protein GF361_00955 [Candidatus Woesearchaeota archaeon]|nr:hypothetical protein [Candidatus Woesearchaeota archaeon]